MRRMINQPHPRGCFFIYQISCSIGTIQVFYYESSKGGKSMSKFLFNLGYRMEMIGISVLRLALLSLIIYPVSKLFLGNWWVMSGQDWMKWGLL